MTAAGLQSRLPFNPEDQAAVLRRASASSPTEKLPTEKLLEKVDRLQAQAGGDPRAAARLLNHWIAASVDSHVDS